MHIKSFTVDELKLFYIAILHRCIPKEQQIVEYSLNPHIIVIGMVVLTLQINDYRS